MSLLLFVIYVLPMCLSMVLYLSFLREESKGFEELHIYTLWCVLPLFNWMMPMAYTYGLVRGLIYNWKRK